MIVITGDTQRPSPQYHNILWLYELIKFQISKLAKREPMVLGQTFPLSFDEWMNYTEVHELIGANLYIGFELNNRFKKKASEIGAKYIDIRIHPIRFMDDLVMGVSSNFINFSSFKVPEAKIYLASAMVRAAVAHVQGVRCEPNTALVVGQTRGDKSVIFDREYSIDDFGPKLVDKLSEYDLVLYKHHPYELNRPNFLLNLDHVDCINTNIYKLLSIDQIKLVAGLSSSVLYEAKYFGKESLAMLPTWWDNYTPVEAKTFLSFDFWRHCLQGFKLSGFDIEVPHHHSMLRKSLRAYWGYDVLDKLP